jgi:uncharacterized protein
LRSSREQYASAPSWEARKTTRGAWPASIGAYRPALQKKNAQIKTTESRPRQYYWSEKSEQAEVAVVEDQGADEHLLSGGASIKESDLYPLLSEYLWSEFRVYSKRIDEKKSSNKHGPKGNKWLYPDVVGMEDLTADWHQEIKQVVKELPHRQPTRIDALIIAGLSLRARIPPSA